MSKATIKRFLMLLSSKGEVEQAQLYQLIQAAERCYCLRNVKGQHEFGSALKLFHSPFDLIGEYYQTTYLYKQGQKDTALEILDKVREQAPHTFQDKALLTIGGIHELEGDIDEAMKVRLVAAKSDTLSIALDAALGIAALLGMEGKHDKAVEYLENVLPHAAKLGSVPLRFDLWNSYATELAEQGKTEEAMKVIIPVVQSPYVEYHPNWLDTEREIREKSSRKSMVTFNRSNVIAFPVREVEAEQEIEDTETEETEPRYPYRNHLIKEFELEDQIEVWMYESVQPDDLGTLFVMLGESRDENERDLIIEKAINYTFMHSDESKEAKTKWRDKIISKMKPPEK